MKIGRKLRFNLFFFSLLSLLFSFGANKENKFVYADDYIFNWDEVLTPFWEGETVYMESVLVVQEPDCTIKPIDLIYPIEEVVKITNAKLNAEFVEGVDFSVYKGQLIINPKGSIPTLSYDIMHPATGETNFVDNDGNYLPWHEGAWYHNQQIVVTYKHEALDYDGYLVERKGALLPKLMTKLQEKKDINLLVYGDSLMEGGNSSGNHQIRVSPYMPIYPDLFAEGLRRTYSVNVNVYNEAVGGTDSSWGVANFTNLIKNKHSDVDFDLALVGFGANDTQKPLNETGINVNRICKSIRNIFKNCETIMVASTCPNRDAPYFYNEQDKFPVEFMKYEEEGNVVCNVCDVQFSLLEKKNYGDITGNYINHINDFFARVYATSLLRCIEYDESYIEDESSEIESISSIDSSLEIESIDSAREESIESSIASNDDSSSISSGDVNKGCGGSIVSSSILFASIAIILMFVIKIRKNKIID